MTTDTTEKGLETLIVEAMTGSKADFCASGHRAKNQVHFMVVQAGYSGTGRTTTANMQ